MNPVPPLQALRRPALAVSFLFLALCLTHVVQRIGGLEQHFELTPTANTPAVYGQQVLSFDYQPARHTMERVVVFVVREEVERQVDRRALLTLRDPASSAVVHQTESVVRAVRHKWRDDLEFETNWKVEAGRTYRLELSLPDVLPEDAPRFHMSTVYEGAKPRLWVGNKELPGQDLDRLVFASRPSFPTLLILSGLLLLLIALVKCPAWGPGASLLITIGMSAALSVFVWEGGVWRFYGQYWPDSRVFLGHILATGLGADASLGQAWQLVSGHLQGATPVIPMLLALLAQVGLPYVYGFALLSLLFGSATLLVIGRFLRRHTSLEPRQVAIVVAMAGLHFAVLRGFVRPQTGAAGVFFSVLFVSAMVDLAGPSSASAGSWCLGLLSIVVGLLSRIALLPLLALPATLGAWRLVTGAGRHSRIQVLRPVQLTIVSCAVLALLYQLLGLWDSLAQMRDTAAGSEYTTLIPTTWATHSAWALQLALPLGLLHWRRVLGSDALLVPTLTACGFLAMLIVFEVIPWYRYWAPVAPAAVIVSGILLFDGVQRPAGWRYGLCAITVVANLGWVAIEKSY